MVMETKKGKIKSAIASLRGEAVSGLKIFGIQIYLLTRISPSQYNLFVFYLPILRIIKSKERFALNVLLFSWIHNFIFSIRFEKLSNGFRIAALGKCVYENIILEPYKFLATNFKDPQKKG